MKKFVVVLLVLVLALLVASPVVALGDNPCPDGQLWVRGRYGYYCLDYHNRWPRPPIGPSTPGSWAR